MTHPIRNRSRLMLGCGSAALALALAMAPQAARAQGIDAIGNVVLGSAEFTDLSPTETLVEVFDPTVVIDWTPNENRAGDALDFIRAGATARFEGPSLPNFAVLNRILPSTNGNIAVIDGTVISRAFDPNSGGLVQGGFVAFYSPTGILIGNNATFDVGSLMLTTLNITDANFQNFASNGSMQMQGAQGSTARIQINPGAQISALAENSFFAVVAADVQMLGSARINGSHAYVAGEVVNLSFSNGLFDISVPVGTAATGQVMTLDGHVGGPSSNGLGDNHMIYALARASQDPISMLFTRNLGFDPAQSAGIVNGEIILSANHNVFGRTVDGGSISDGIDAVFSANSATSDVQADILIQNFTATSSLLAISSHNTDLTAGVLGSSVSGNLLLVGRARASMGSSFGTSLTVSGDVLVSAQDYGVVSSSLQNLDVINAAAGNASIFAGTVSGSSIDIGGNVLVAADAFAGADDLNRIAGSALAGQASIVSSRGDIAISGNATVSARGIGTSVVNILSGATVRGGLALFAADTAGTILLDGNLNLSTEARGAFGSLVSPSSVSNAYGGQSRLSLQSGGGSIAIGGDAFASASAFGGSSNNAGAGSIGDAGQAIANIDGGGQITITGALLVEADGIGGDNAGGTGGVGLGGRASSAIFSGGTIDIGLDFEARADGGGGGGQTGGDGFGGIAGANAVIGTINIGGSADVRSAGLGGSASYGFGGTGGLGRGGNAFLQANGTLTDAASLSIGGDAIAFAQGEGGNGGNSDGSITAAGRGGDGYGGEFTLPNQADPAFNSGVFILAGGDNGTIRVTGEAVALASGFGGQGGNGGSVQTGGRGGDGFGGLAQVGLALLGGDGSLGQGSASFASLRAEAEASAGSGGFSIGDFPSGNGGNATGGNAFLTLRAGTLTTDSVELDARAYGGEGANGGNATGGIAASFGSLGGRLTTDAFIARASGFGGFGGLDAFAPGNGGNGTGGQAELDLSGVTVQINGDARIEAEGEGGGTGDFTAGNGTGGTARLGVLGTIAGSGTITGNTIVSANGFGGGANNGVGSISGDGTGGTATIRAATGGTLSLQTLQLMANGFGGEGEIIGYAGGDGTGGNANIIATGTGSQVTIARNVTSQQFNQQNFGAIMSATGVGRLGSGGAGVGGIGRGGTAQLTASQGGRIALPADPLNDPNTVGFIRVFARGSGGNTIVNGGTGGTSFGGNVNIDVDGGTLTSGAIVPSSFTQGGTAQNGALNVTGGNAFAGSRRVSIRNGGTASINFVGGGAGAQGGNGSGTGNGGNAYIGQNLFEIVNASATIIGQAAIFDQSQGGNGQQGGSVFTVNPLTGLRGSLNIVLDNANITFTPDASGVAGIGGDFVTRGGTGVVRGGDAQGPDFNVTINQTNLSGGQLRINPFIQGGDATALDGIGGHAFGSLVNIVITNSQLTLPGETLFAADALGGAGGANGTGGSGTSGTVDVTITGSTLNLVADQQGVPGSLRISAQGNGRLGGQVGDGTSNRAVLNLVNSTITATQVEITARSGSAASGGLGGDAIGGEARLSLAGTSGITADLVRLDSSAFTGQGGTATGGTSAIDVGTGATATLTTPQIVLLADGLTSAADVGGIAGVTQGGQSRIGATGGSLTITGNVTVNANATGAIAASILSGAVARAGQARVFAAQGGSLSIGGDLSVAANAFGSRGSLIDPASVSDAFGGLAVLETGTGGGTINIGGKARLIARGDGGTSNNAGVGSLGDGGTAIANINNGGLIAIIGQLELDAIGLGGNNSGGAGGTGLGGRASSAIFAGGTINIGGRFNSEALGEGGDGLSGGDGLGGISGANAVIGTIIIGDHAFAGSEGVGGDATFGFGGDGGLGRGGNAFFQANGTLTQPARVAIAGDASVSAQGVGGNGGDGNGGTIGAGRGGDGIGGQFNVPNQADPGFGSGTFILAGGDNGTISVGGQATAVASGFGGIGGDGLDLQVGGDGGNGFGGSAQVGLALLGQSGSLGQGSASFRRVFAEANGFGNDGGTARTGNGGTGTGGGAFLAVRAGDIIADQMDFAASGFGGEGVLAGSGTGGVAALVGSLGGTLTATGATFSAQGFGGGTLAGNGGNATGGLAAIEGDGISMMINGSALLNASATGGASDNGAGGNATGGEARFTMAGDTTVTTDLIEIVSNAKSSIGGATFAGRSALDIRATGQISINTNLINLLADGFGADRATGANRAGQFSVSIAGGNVNAGAFFASATGDRVNFDLDASQLIVDSGNLNVATSLTTRTIGDLLVRTDDGGIIGSPATAGTTTAIELNANGAIEIVGNSSSGGLGGRTIDMLAGRSILIDSNLSTNNGAITLNANRGAAQPQAPAPVSAITMTEGARINAGTGTVTINLLDGGGDPQRVSGAIRLSAITGGLINVRNFGTSPGSNISVLASGVLTASGAGRAIDLASLNGEVTNLAGDAGLVLTGGGHYGIFAATPTGSQIGSFANYSRRYNVVAEAAYDLLNPGGNFAAFRFAPVLTVRVNDATRFYGSVNPQFTASFAGFLPGDGIGGLTGAPEFITLANSTSNVGAFTINAARGTLLSEQGYQFTFSPGVLSITPRPITVTANDLSRIYGNANPALTFTVGGDGLVNGDLLTGALATIAGQTTGIGNYLITRGTLAASDNYLVTFVNGQLTITRRPLALVADSFSRLFGLPDPQFTFRITDGNLVNGDQLTGTPVRDAGEAIGSFAIRQGTVSAGDNYAINFLNGQLTIDPPPAPDVLTSPTIIAESLQTGEDPLIASEEEEERFGMNFPEQYDAPLISEDTLRYDPVTSGGDASLYSGGGVGNVGIKDK